MLQQNKYHPLPTKAPNRLLNRLTVGGVYTRKSKMRSLEKFHRATVLLLVMKLMDVEYLHITTSRQCCTNTCNLTPLGPSQKTPNLSFRPPWPWMIHHHPAIFWERRSSNSSGNVCKDHCFNICLRNFPLLLPLLVLVLPRRMASLNQRDQIWTCKMSEPKSCEPKLHLSLGKTMKTWRWWMMHTQPTKKLSPQMCEAETNDGWGSVSRSWELKGKSDGKMSTWYCSITIKPLAFRCPSPATNTRTRKVIKVSWQFFVTFLGWLSDLQPNNEKVTLNHLDDNDSECLFLFDGFLFIQQIVLGWTATRANVVFIIQNDPKCLYFSLHLKRWKDFGQISLNEFKRTKQVAILLLILPVAYDCQEVCILRPIVWVDLVPLLPPKR